jgi:cytochrome oxidase Cu insertion factor (SCO1/SenC/PrrC family)
MRYSRVDVLSCSFARHRGSLPHLCGVYKTGAHRTHVRVARPFASAFGVAVMREADKTITHNLRTAVVDPEGRLLSIYDGSAWTPDRIAADMKRVLAR